MLDVLTIEVRESIDWCHLRPFCPKTPKPLEHAIINIECYLNSKMMEYNPKLTELLASDPKVKLYKEWLLSNGVIIDKVNITQL